MDDEFIQKAHETAKAHITAVMHVATNVGIEDAIKHATATCRTMQHMAETLAKELRDIKKKQGMN